jgi:hypothetical protein
MYNLSANKLTNNRVPVDAQEREISRLKAAPKNSVVYTCFNFYELREERQIIEELLKRSEISYVRIYDGFLYIYIKK